MDLTEIIDAYEKRFKTAYDAKITRAQINAINAVLDCRTARYGKMLLNCTPCHLQQSRFQSCGHRSCHLLPKYRHHAMAATTNAKTTSRRIFYGDLYPAV